MKYLAAIGIWQIGFWTLPNSFSLPFCKIAPISLSQCCVNSNWQNKGERTHRCQRPGWGESRSAVVNMQNTSFFLHYYLLIVVLFPLWTTVNLLLPTLYIVLLRNINSHILARELLNCPWAFSLDQKGSPTPQLTVYILHMNPVSFKALLLNAILTR